MRRIQIIDKIGINQTELGSVVHALQVQLFRDFCPLWNIQANVFVSKENDLTEYSEVLYIINNSDHIDSFYKSRVKAYSYVFGFNSILLSHNLLELLVDPQVNTLIYNPRLNSCHALDCCDPAQDNYDINNVWVSNFVLPSYYNYNNETWIDFMCLLKDPYSISKEGYYLYFKQFGDWQVKSNLPFKVPERYSREFRRMS